MRSGVSRRLFTVRAVSIVSVGAMLSGGATCSLNGGGLLPSGSDDQAAACRKVSPGGEIAVGAALRGVVVKAGWSFGDCTLERSGGNEKVTLIAKNAIDGFYPGDSSSVIKVIFERNGSAMDLGTYIDLPSSSDQPRSFQVFASSSPNTNAQRLFDGTGSAIITDYKVTGTRVTLKATFTVKVFDTPTATVLDMCGEVNFEGPVTISG